MALTRNFKETVQARVLADPAFREALLREGIEAMLAGDVDTGKLILRDYIKATVGFEELGAETGTSAKSLIRMFGARGNPQARNFFAVLSRLQERAGLRLQVTTQPRRRTTAPTRNAKALNRTAAVARRVGAANC
ncbi:MAG TPA: transcriptional regulator [Steroidobacteraceae bacterium]|jgi:DNA-binding phage protein|nr:transcriptional regulator [Steroidobacteraceae bacterium]